MSFEVLRILQIGDIHQPEWPLEREGRDVKTALQSQLFADGLGWYRIERILAALLHHADSADAIVFVGDYTTKGDALGLETCIAHFAALLRPELGSDRDIPIIAVPGNHDVNKDFATDVGISSKFRTLQGLVRYRKWQALPVETLISTDLERNGMAAGRIFSVNTCMGSWELAAFGESTLQTLTLLRQMTETGRVPKVSNNSFVNETGDVENLQYDNYDAPFVLQNVLSAMSQALSQAPPSCALIAVGHHNLLQQEVPRYAPYAELLNSGALRKTLQACDRSTIYLHGHIHDGPIEIISDAENPNRQIVSVSAPALTHGFNLLEVHVTEDGPPLGVNVRRFRLKPNGNVMEELPVTIPLFSLTHKQRVLKREAEVIAVVEDEQRIRFVKLIDLPKIRALGLPEKDLGALVISLYWRKLLHIDYISSPSSEWMLKAMEA